MINKTLAILAGGKSSRMNYNNKGLLNYNKRTFIENIMIAGRNYKEIIIIANDFEEYKRFNVKIFKDMYANSGPISGIHSALINSTTEKVLCIACDMPLINEEVLNLLGSYDEEEYEVLVPNVNGKIQPLCSIYSKEIIDKVKFNIKKNKNKLQELIFDLDYKLINNPKEEYFFNINTVEEYKNLLKTK